MHTAIERSLRYFRPPIVMKRSQGITAFHAYDWYFARMRKYMQDKEAVFLTPCAAMKPIHSSPLHLRIYQKYAARYGRGRELLGVSEPATLIRYQDLYDLERHFFYKFPRDLLDNDARALFVSRLKTLLCGKDVAGCLPRHHAEIISQAIGKSWTNHWHGDLFMMMYRASVLNIQPAG